MGCCTQEARPPTRPSVWRAGRSSVASRTDGTPVRARTAPVGRRLGPVRDRVRQRRLLDLLRARPGRLLRARSDPGHLHVRRRAVRADRQDLRGGRGDVPRSRRLLVVRPPRVRRRRLFLRRLGAEPRLHHHDRHLRVLRAALPRRVLPGAHPQPRRHLRRADHDRAARRAEHPRARRVGETEPVPGDRRPVHADAARGPRLRAGAEPVAAGQPGAPRRRTDVDTPDLRAVGGDGRVHRHRDRLEHGRGGEGPRQRRSQRGQPRGDRRARRLRRHLRRRALSAARRQARARIRHAARHHLRKRPRAGHPHAPAPARHGADVRQRLRRDSRGDDPVHRHQRGADRDLAAVVVAGRAPPAPEPVLSAAPALPHAVVHDRVLLDPRRPADPPRPDETARQPVLVRRDAVVHHRARVGGGAARERPGPRAALPAAVERQRARAVDPADGGARRHRHVRRVVRGRRAAHRGAHDRHPLDGAGDGRLLPVSQAPAPESAGLLPHRAPGAPGGLRGARVQNRARADLRR